MIKKVTGTPYTKSLESDPDTMMAYPAPWDMYDEMTVERSDHMVLMSDASHARELHAAKGDLQKAGDEVLALWKADGPGRPASPGFALVYEPDTKKAAALYGQGGQDRGEDGVTIPMKADVLGAQQSVAGARVVSRVTDARVGKHEMVHALLEPLTGPTAVGSLGGPEPWVVEGLAEYVASTGSDDRGMHTALQRSGFNGLLPDLITFYSKDSVRQAANYEQGRLAIGFMADRYGKKKALAFAAAHYGQPSDLDEQLREATGKDKSGFQAEWAEYVRGTLR
ncbi:hypothetical protein AC230_29165 [Streptomyces caatingaensis]|uniref:Uncharacterized protein n=1 Tax=Streptomyces caatingaensis TaxID=1678637 RepID=A0A0K9X9L8_9ACTN|nr:hypothetical protein AC230_29165 [Streptomyces caatingaensis]